MNNLEMFGNHINFFFSMYYNGFNCFDTIHNASHDMTNKEYLIDNVKYNEMTTVSMDYIVKNGYKFYKKATTKKLPNTVDSFMIDKNNIWYFIEFKNQKISNAKRNIDAKGLNNLLVIIDIMRHSMKKKEIEFDNLDPMNFIRNNCVYIVVVNGEKDPETKNQVRNKNLISEKYTPEFLEKFKQFYFKDAYVYTTEFFEHKFLSNFSY